MLSRVVSSIIAACAPSQCRFEIAAVSAAVHHGVTISSSMVQRYTGSSCLVDVKLMATSASTNRQASKLSAPARSGNGRELRRMVKGGSATKASRPNRPQKKNRHADPQQHVYHVAHPPNSLQQQHLKLHGHRLTGDPGTLRYTAPRYLPERLRHNIPRVIYSDPWPLAEDADTRRHDARACVDWLRINAPGGASAKQVFEGLNAQATLVGGAEGSSQLNHEGSSTKRDTPANEQERPRRMGSVRYVRILLERLRLERFLQGRINPLEHDINPASPNYPRLYTAKADQAAKFGGEYQIKQREWAFQQNLVVRALRRLRRGKPPYPIFRRTASSSRFHYELAMEQARRHMSEMQVSV